MDGSEKGGEGLHDGFEYSADDRFSTPENFENKLSTLVEILDILRGGIV